MKNQYIGDVGDYGKYGYLENDALATLAFGDTPLIKFQANEAYFCPTCEKLVAAGYSLNMSDQKVISELREVLNHKFISLEKSLENLQLLMGLLPSGYMHSLIQNYALQMAMGSSSGN